MARTVTDLDVLIAAHTAPSQVRPRVGINLTLRRRLRAAERVARSAVA